MPVMLTGVLYDPYSELAVDSAIRFTAESTSYEVLKGFVAEAETNEAGEYSLEVRFGTYTISVRQKDADAWRSIATGILVTEDVTADDLNELIVEGVGWDDYTPELVQAVRTYSEAATAAADTATSASASAASSSTSAADSASIAIARGSSADASATAAAGSAISASDSAASASASADDASGHAADALAAQQAAEGALASVTTDASSLPVTAATTAGTSRQLGEWTSQLATGDALVLWTGQSNAVQPWDNSDTPDEISSKVRIWNGSEFVLMSPGVGGISADATNHSLFNFTRRLVDELGYQGVKVVMEAKGSTPIAEWSGTPGDRTISSTNRPMMQRIVESVTSSEIGAFDFVVMIQGENNASDQMLPSTLPGAYLYEREYFRQSLDDLGYTNNSTRWIECEVLGRDVAAYSWRANYAIRMLDKIGRKNVAIVSSAGFQGEDEGHTINGETYTLHLAPLENSEYGNRIFSAASSLFKLREPTTSLDIDILAPSGQVGFVHPIVELNDETIDLSSQWARNGMIRVGGTCNITLKSDDLRFGTFANGGRRITFELKNDAVLNLTTETYAMEANVGGINRNPASSITRTRTNTPDRFVSMVWNGSLWQIDQDLSFYYTSSLLPSGQAASAKLSGGYLEIFGTIQVTNTAGSSVEFTFPADMPIPDDANYRVALGGSCTRYNKSTSGFSVIRDVVNGSTAFVDFHISGAYKRVL